jgi:hypothetical protein
MQASAVDEGLHHASNGSSQQRACLAETRKMNLEATYLLIVDCGASSDLTKDHDHASLCARLAGNAGGLILAQAGV